MSISFSGLASGLDTSSWVEALVSVKQSGVTELNNQLLTYKAKQATLTSTQSFFTKFRTSLEKFTDAKFGGTFDLFTKNTATSSNTDVFTATADSDAARQSYDIVVQQLATRTIATSKYVASDVADDNTKLSNLGIKTGAFSVYLDGARTQIDIEENDTFGDLKSKLSEAGINTQVDENGILTFSATDNTKNLNIGATTDTTNIVALYGINKQSDGNYSSTNSLYKVTTATNLTSADAGFRTQITEGTFSIGNATFTINQSTTLSSIISEINNNSDAQATASWDDTTGKMIITSKVEGASYINIQAGTSNFTDVLGFTTSSTDSDGNNISKMYTDAQELGQNALLTINGTSIISTSNKVSPDISRIKGVTITLNDITKKDDEGNLQTSKLEITQDNSELTKAVENFISAYNEMVYQIDNVTATGGDLERDTSLKSFKNTIRNYANGSNSYNGGSYNLLAQIGISTGKADANNLSTDCDTLEFDKDTFEKALQDDPDSVKALLCGENGIFKQMESSVEQMLSASTGYFDVTSATLKNDISKLNTKITTETKKVDTYKTSLENKFYKMELAISQMQQNYSSFLTAS